MEKTTETDKFTKKIDNQTVQFEIIDDSKCICPLIIKDLDPVWIDGKCPIHGSKCKN
jgi:hypothetical protein